MLAKPLTNDQRKAAEAAFRGLPFNPSWSTEARTIYDGIIKSMEGRIVASDEERPAAGGQVSGEPAGGDTADRGAERTAADLSGLTRDEAVQTGYLVDVTREAQQIGLSLPVGLTKPLWDIGITIGDSIPEGERSGRVRDLLMALRLHLERAALTTPLSEFPALLTFPPETAPQVCPLFVLAHRDVATPYCLTVLLPREVSLIQQITPQH